MPFSLASVISSDSGCTDEEGPLSVRSIQSVDTGIDSESTSSVLPPGSEVPSSLKSDDLDD